MNIIFFLTFLILNILSYVQPFQDFIFDNMLFSSKRNPDDLNLKEWLNQLVIDLPNDLINETQGFIQDLTIYNISLESLITSRKILINKKMGVNITFRNAGLNIKGKHTILSKEPKNFVAKISSLKVKLPFFLVKNETGLVTEVDTTGFSIDIDQAQIDLEIEDMSDVAGNIIVGVLKLVLKFIRANVIEKNLIRTMNEKLEGAFEFVNHIILNRAEPDKLNITINQTDLADLRYSQILGSVALIFASLEGVNGSMSLNNMTNQLTNNTGILQLKQIYDKEIHFEFNITDKENNSLGNFEISLDDLNISGINTFKDIKVILPYDPLQLSTYITLQNLTLDLDFSLRVKLDNTSKLVKNKTILYEKAQLRTNLRNNSLKALFQIAFNNKRSFEYTNNQCLDLGCIFDLIDANGTGISYLAFNETFTYITLGVKDGGYLEEDLDDTISRLTDLFITGFDNEIGILINAILNTTVINLLNRKLNEFLSSKQNCKEIPDPSYEIINYGKMSAVIGACVGAFFMFIFSPYILCKALKKKKEERIIEENDINREPTISSESKDDRAPDPKYCIDSISIKWLKEFGRIDPEGASLFLNPKIPLFFRICLPLAIFLTLALYICCNIAKGALVFLIFKVGRRIQVSSYLDFSLIQNIHDLWVGGSKGMAFTVVLFSLVWPYVILLLMFIGFCFPTSIISHKNRGRILTIVEATAKFTLYDFFLVIMLLLDFHFLIPIPVVPQYSTKEKTIIDIVVEEKFGYVALIVGTFVLLILSHILIHLHRSLDSHPDENKGEKAQSCKAIISFAKVKYLKKIPFRIILSILLVLDLGLVIAGGIPFCFAYFYEGLAGYLLDIFQIPINRELGVLIIEFVLPEAYEFEKDALLTQIVYFATVYVIPITFLVFAGLLWFVPMPRKAQKVFYSIVEILSGWSCTEVLTIAIAASVTGIVGFTDYVIDDKFGKYQPLVKKYFSKILDGKDTLFTVKPSFKFAFWLYFPGAVLFCVTSYFILKVSKDVLDERLPDHVKDYLKIKKDDNSRISDINDFSSRTTTLDNESSRSNKANNKNLLAED